MRRSREQGSAGRARRVLQAADGPHAHHGRRLVQTSHGVQWASERESSVGNSIDEIDYEVLASVLKELGMLSRIVFRSAWWRGRFIFRHSVRELHEVGRALHGHFLLVHRWVWRRGVTNRLLLRRLRAEHLSRPVCERPGGAEWVQTSAVRRRVSGHAAHDAEGRAVQLGEGVQGQGWALDEGVTRRLRGPPGAVRRREQLRHGAGVRAESRWALCRGVTRRLLAAAVRRAGAGLLLRVDAVLADLCWRRTGVRRRPAEPGDGEAGQARVPVSVHGSGNTLPEAGEHRDGRRGVHELLEVDDGGREGAGDRDLLHGQHEEAVEHFNKGCGCAARVRRRRSVADDREVQAGEPEGGAAEPHR